MVKITRWLLVALLVVHGLIHLLGAAKGFGWGTVSPLSEPISAGMAAVWMLAAVLVLATAAMIVAATPSWRCGVALLAALASQVAIMTSWGDARSGTVFNVVLLIVAVHGFLATGPFSFSAQFARRTHDALNLVQAASTTVNESDMDVLPTPLADYIRRTGAVGKPRTTSFSANIHGRIRSAPDQAWMPFTAKQVNTYGENPQRMFLMNARRSGLPVEVLHVFHDSTATMKVKLLAAFSLVDAKGPEMDRGETVTLFQELVALAPGAIIDAPIQWTAVDFHQVRGVYTVGQCSVSATLIFNEDHDLVNFISPDRFRASSDGAAFTPQGWSTPLLEHVHSDGRRVLAMGEGRWDAPPPEGTFSYLEIHLDAISFDVGASGPESRTETTLDSVVAGL